MRGNSLSSSGLNPFSKKDRESKDQKLPGLGDIYEIILTKFFHFILGKVEALREENSLIQGSAIWGQNPDWNALL